jgi:hypothetical protein
LNTIKKPVPLDGSETDYMIRLYVRSFGLAPPNFCFPSLGVHTNTIIESPDMNTIRLKIELNTSFYNQAKIRSHNDVVTVCDQKQPRPRKRVDREVEVYEPFPVANS